MQEQRMDKLVIDLNSIISSRLLVGKDPDGYKVEGVQINTADYGYDNFLTSYKKVLDTLGLTPMHTVAVFDDKGSRKARQRIYKEYKEHRKPRPEEYYTEFNAVMAEAKQFIRELGGTVVCAKGKEADDTIAHIAPKIGGVIWSSDKDLLSIGVPMIMNGSEIYLGETTGDKFIPGMQRRHIRLYRALVSDPGDFGPGMGAKGFGNAAFIDAMAAFGDDGLDQLAEIIQNKDIPSLQENVEDLKAVQKIIDSEETVYTTWALSGWLPIKDHQLKWEPGFTHGRDCETYDEAFDHWYQSSTLVDGGNFDGVAELILNNLIHETNYVALDIETDVPEESKPWLEKIYQELGKKKAPIQVDVYASKLAGLSLTLGENLNHTFYFSIDHVDSNNIPTDKVKDLIMAIDKPKVAHNAGGFELPVLNLNWNIWIPDMYCSMIAMSYVDENDFKGLKYLSKKYYRYEQISYEVATGGKGMSECTAEQIFDYGCDDTIMGGHLFNFFELVMDIEGTFDAYAEVEKDSLYMSALAFTGGMNVNLKILEELREKDLEKAEESYKVIEKYLIAMGWDGTVFEPIEELTPTEIKRGFKMITKNVLKTSFRKLDKVIAVVTDEAEERNSDTLREYAKLLDEGDLSEINQFLSDNFMPDAEFKSNSWVQKQKLMYEIMGLPIRYYGKLTEDQKKKGMTNGNPSTDEDAIKWALKDCEERGMDTEAKVLKAVLRVINFKTRDGLYYSTYPIVTHWKTGKIHPNLKQSATSSRRFAPAGPNVNQLPKRSEEGKKVRQAIIPHHEDAVIISPDFSGQELRVGAFQSGDENSRACYVGDNLKDQHTITAFAINQKQGKEFDTYEEMVEALHLELEMTSEMISEAARDINHPHHKEALAYKKAKEYRGVKAKPTNFLSQYITVGGGAWTLGKKLQITEDEAVEFLEAKSEAFPGIDEWKINRGAEIRSQGYAETLLGARKHITGLFKYHDPDHIMRSALNFEVQSSSAEMTKLVLAEIWRSGMMFRYDVKFYMPVHDELCFSVAKKDLQAFALELKPIMMQAYANMDIPIVSSFCVGPNFGQLSEIEWEAADDWLAKQQV